MSVINRNFVVQSLQGVIPPNSYDLIDFDDRVFQIIAYAVTLDRSIIGKVLWAYFESSRRQPIANPSAFIISSLRKEFDRETSRRMMNPGCGDKPACRNHWHARRLARAPHTFEKADHKAKPTVNSRFLRAKAVIERLYKNLQLDTRMLDVGSLHTILLVLSQGSRSWGVNNTSSIMEDMARCDTGKHGSDKISQRGFQQYAQLHSSVIQQLDLPEVEQLSEYRQRLWLRVCSVCQDEGLKNAGPSPLDDAAGKTILKRLLDVRM